MSHRSYQPTQACGSKLLQQKWDAAYYREHRRMVKNPVRPQLLLFYVRRSFVGKVGQADGGHQRSSEAATHYCQVEETTGNGCIFKNGD